jgi:error-prone DNA polymerase
MEAEMIVPFIRRRHGLEEVSVAHPAMEEVLRDTYGVIVYQEQVLSVAEAVAGFDLAEADSLRRMMTKGRSPGEMAVIRTHFIERALEHGASQDVAEEVFRQLEGFAAYGFNKAHATCFAVVSYASAWLKHYFPAEFACALINHQPMGFYSARLVLDDARRHGIEVLPPHVNDSVATCTVAHGGGAVRVGLARLMYMSDRLLARIRAERDVRPFEDLADLLKRTEAEERAVASLVEVGALDGLGLTDAGRPPTRDEMLALLPEVKAVLARREERGDATLLIAPGPAREAEDLTHPSGWPLSRRLSAEMRLAGLAISAHPLELAREDLASRGVTWACELAGLDDRTQVTVAGVRERAQTPRTRSGRRTCFLTLEDPTGLVDVVVFEDALAKAGETIVRNRAYVVHGTLQNNPERGLAVVARDIEAYRVRTPSGEAVTMRRGVGQGPLGPTRGGTGAPDEEPLAEPA